MVSFLSVSRTSLATFHEGKHNISHMSMDVARGLMVTCGTDRVVKVTCQLAPQCRLLHRHAMNVHKALLIGKLALPFDEQPIATWKPGNELHVCEFPRPWWCLPRPRRSLQVSQ